MDKIIISGLQVNSVIGVYEWERQAKTALTVDVELSLDLRTAAHSDDVDDTLDYALVAQTLERVANDASFQLLEALAGHMVSALFTDFAASQISLTVSKPGILPNAQNVAVQLNRSR